MFFLPNLKQNNHLDNLTITACIVGSREMFGQTNFAGKDWSIFAPNLTIYNFDADDQVCQKAEEALKHNQVNWQEYNIPLALWNKEESRTLYITNHPGCTSLHQPNDDYLKRFHNYYNWTKCVNTTQVKTTTLDEFFQDQNRNPIDFIHMDVQGAELQVLEGAENLLKQEILLICTEVLFGSLYENQTFFRDLDHFLNHKEFNLLDLVLGDGRGIRSNTPIFSQSHPGTLIWGDAFYCRDLIEKRYHNHVCYTPENLLKLACLADLFDFLDYAFELLVYLTLHYGENPQYNFANSMITSLLQHSQYNSFEQICALPFFSKIQKYVNFSLFTTNQDDVFLQSLGLREINYIIFPDWSQTEEKIRLELIQLFRQLITHPEQEKITLLIDITSISEEDANLMISNVFFNLLMLDEYKLSEEEEAQMREDIGIAFVPHLNSEQYTSLMPYLSAKINLAQESQIFSNILELKQLPEIEL